MSAKYEAEARVSKGLGQLLEHTGVSTSMIKTARTTAAMATHLSLADTIASLGGDISRMNTTSFSSSNKQSSSNNQKNDNIGKALLQVPHTANQQQSSDPAILTTVAEDNNKADVDNTKAGRKPVIKSPSHLQPVVLVGKVMPGAGPTTLARSMRELEKMKETQRANQAEAQLDVMKSENDRLASAVCALTDYLKSLGHDVAV